MAFVNMSEIAYAEFKELLTTNNIDCNVIRLYLAGMGCSGPAFNLVVDEIKENDAVSQIKDLMFIVDKDLVNQYGSFTLISGSENGRGGFSIETEIQPEGGGCAGCGGGCSS